MTENKNSLGEESLELHASGRPGKIEICPTKPLETRKDLSLAYSPGVAAPCLEIEKDPAAAFRYTAKGNLVAVVSNGTAVLGLGDIGALASKPVMEGKAVLFKRFADVDAIDIEINSKDPEKVIETVKLIGDGFGGINLEDIKAPECFRIERELREKMNIPVFHDDQHGTAVVVAAGLMNGLIFTGKWIGDVKVVVNGAGAAAIACASLMREMGVENLIMCDTKGVIYKGRTEGMNSYKAEFAVETDARTLADAVKGADVFVGLSVKGALSPEMVKTMAAKPMVFALANPNPEITPEEALEAAPDAIVATGRSDYPNQINNVLGFPYIFRGALDVRASKINEEMKKAAASALAMLAREEAEMMVKEGRAAWNGGSFDDKSVEIKKNHIVPGPFNPALMEHVSFAVAKAACDSGAARRPVTDWELYRESLRARMAKKG